MTPPGVCSMTVNETTKEEEVEISQRRKSSVLKRKFSSKLKFSICLTVLLVITLLPATISSFIDLFVVNPPYQQMIFVSTFFLFFYCACCPILMWKFLPSLRSSTAKFYIAVKKGRSGMPRQHSVDRFGTND